jgi:hypothetical protein
LGGITPGGLPVSRTRLKPYSERQSSRTPMRDAFSKHLGCCL